MRKLTAAAFLLAFLTHAQPREPRFDVASVKAGVLRDGVSRGMRLLPDGKLSIGMFTLKQIAGLAYDLQLYQVLGGPSWMESDYFMIEAQADLEESERTYVAQRVRTLPVRYRLMLRSLLADRFELRAHSEKREQTTYDLVVGKGGLKLKAAPPNANPRGGSFPGGRITAEGESMAWLADQLSRWYFHVPVQDRTQLTGEYDFSMQFEEPPRSGRPPLPGTEFTPAEVPMETADSLRPTIFGALAKLGLRLDRRKAPVEVLVTDHVVKPTPN